MWLSDKEPKVQVNFLLVVDGYGATKLFVATIRYRRESTLMRDRKKNQGHFVKKGEIEACVRNWSGLTLGNH